MGKIVLHPKCCASVFGELFPRQGKIVTKNKLMCFHYLEIFNGSTTRKNSFIGTLMFPPVLSIFSLSGKTVVTGKILCFH